MPTYTFKNTKTNEEFNEYFSSYDASIEYLEQNPDIKKLLTTASFIGGRTIEGGKLPSGFRDQLKLIKQKHPRGKGVDHLI
tara:strand:- start:4261 stop:4503 length:243 start_codon:yes stop_codon:yes gene_type:complete